MKKWNKKNRPLCSILVFMLVLILCAPASAGGDKTLQAGCPSRSGETVLSYTKKDGITLSLPGYWDPTAVTLEIPGSDKVMIGKEKREISAGIPVDVTDLLGNKTELWDHRGVLVGRLTILQGSAVPALFIECDAEKLKAAGRSKDKAVTEGRAVWTEADGWGRRRPWVAWGRRRPGCCWPTGRISASCGTGSCWT